MLSREFFISLIFFSFPVYSQLTVSFVEYPWSIPGYYKARIVAASEFDPTPNPCYGRHEWCRLTLSIFSQSSLPGGIGGGSRHHIGWGPKGHPPNAVDWGGDSSYRTIGEWVKTRANIYGLAEDILFESDGENFCVAIAANQLWGMGGYVPNSIVSNCTNVKITPPTCELTPSNISVDFRVNEDMSDSELKEKYLSLKCSADTDIVLTHRGILGSGNINLIGNNSLLALDVGLSGINDSPKWNKPLRMRVKGNQTRYIKTQLRLLPEQVKNSGPGYYL
ncbi:TPA: hypothetical protein ND538_004682, partial [Serratia marcescens]|nr:hypothetical protein [Serratia marcescens]